jgi:DNA excision repair protein ERCC-2
MCPVVLTRGSDQMPVSTKFEMREDDSVIRNYGRMLVELSAAIPDGIVCFFVSYSYMDKIVSKWNDMGILQVCCVRNRLLHHSPHGTIYCSRKAELSVKSKRWAHVWSGILCSGVEWDLMF